MVKPFLQGFPRSQIYDPNRPLLEIDGGDAVMNPSVNVLLFSKDLRRADDQWIQCIDNPADVIGEPSGGIGSVRALFKGNDFPVRFLPADLGRRAHSSGIAANDNQSFTGHKTSNGSKSLLGSKGRYLPGNPIMGSGAKSKD
jgi:hypothetical protein